MDPAEYSEASRQGWSAAAEFWAQTGDEPDRAASAAAGNWILEAAHLEPGHHVLELACGAGRVGLQAAERVGPGGRVLCTDFAEPMVKVTRERAQALGLENVEAHVLDAESIQLGDERFDRVVCRFGFMLMSDPEQAFRESHRIMHPDGRLVLAVWGSAEENPWLSIVLDAVTEHFGAPAPEPGSPGPFALSDEDGLAGLLGRADFREISTERVEVEQTYPSGKEWWEQVTAAGGPLAVALSALPESDLEAIRRHATEAAGAYRDPDERMRFPAVVVGATAASTGGAGDG